MMERPIRLAILASGGGSNALNILKHLEAYSHIEVVLIASNKAEAGVLEHAKTFDVPTYLLNRQNFLESNTFLDVLREYEVDAIILAGFLWKVPHHLVEQYPQKIINIHPALLPKYGGKGMYHSFRK
jgi:phosphoribosylglycinamide formyltransferase 1